MARRIVISVLLAPCLLMGGAVFAQEDAWLDSRPSLLPALLSFKRSGHPHRMQYGGATAPARPVTYASPETAQPGVPYYGSDGIVTKRVPPQPDWLEPSPVEATLAQIFHRSWYRLEWLSWTIEEKHEYNLPPIISRSSDFEFRDNNGVRGTIGVPLSGATWETDAFVLNQHSDQQLQTGGKWTGGLWGAESNIVFDSRYSGPGIQVKPLIGFRYVNLEETLNFPRAFVANLQNNHYGPQVGLRGELVHPWATIGATVTASLSYNTYKARLQTPAFIDENGTKFAPTAELSTYAKVNVSESFSLFVSGNWLWMDNAARPSDAVVVQLDIPRLNPAFNDVLVYGISVGGEIILP